VTLVVVVVVVVVVVSALRCGEVTAGAHEGM